MNVPEGAETVEIEGRDLKMAIQTAAEKLGLHPKQVDYKLDLSHFRSATGVSVARNTVKIVAWSSGRQAPSADELEADTPKPAREKRERKPRRRDDEQAASAEEPTEAEEAAERKPEQLRGAEQGSTEASDFAQGWFENLLELMDVEGKVSGSGNEERVHLAIDAERAGRIVGKRGATLGAIRHLLGLALQKKFGDLTVDVDVGDDRRRGARGGRDRDGRDERGGDRGERRGRDRDRGRGRDRRGRDRGDRGGDRGDRGDRGARGKYPEEKLRALARRAAEKAIESGQTITINLELNSYDRRLVHLEVAEIDGVKSQSEEREEDGRTLKYVQIRPLSE